MKILVLLFPKAKYLVVCTQIFKISQFIWKFSPLIKRMFANIYLIIIYEKEQLFQKFTFLNCATDDYFMIPNKKWYKKVVCQKLDVTLKLQTNFSHGLLSK